MKGSHGSLIRAGGLCHRGLGARARSGAAVSDPQSGLEAQERERQRFLDLADRLTRATGSAEQKRLKEELARLTFGD